MIVGGVMAMQKIHDLTAAQERDLVAYREEWLVHGRSTQPADRATTERVIRAMYSALGEQAPYVWWVDGPATGSMVRAIIRASLGANLGANLSDNLSDNLRANLGDNLGANLWANLRANLRANLWDNLGDNLRWHFRGQHEAAWAAHYTWPDKALRVMHTDSQREQLSWWTDLAKSCGWWQPFRGVVFCCERPSIQSVNMKGQLHSAVGPAILCRDGWSVWAWNNVRVTEQIVMRPHALTKEEIAKETNAQVRQVMVERIGIERVCQLFNAKCLDKRGEYELLALNLGDGLIRPYLKMLNPSMPGIYHVEGVLPTVKTVQEALNWRNGLTVDRIDEVNGVDFYQQGDVIMRPKGASKFKSTPRILT